jgi:hypothetical protein
MKNLVRGSSSKKHVALFCTTDMYEDYEVAGRRSLDPRARSLTADTTVSSLDIWHLIYIMTPKILVNASTNTTNWFICYESSSAIHGQIINFIILLSTVPSSASVNPLTCVNFTVPENFVRRLEQLANGKHADNEASRKEKCKWCIWLKIQVFANGGRYGYHFVDLDVQLQWVVK